VSSSMRKHAELDPSASLSSIPVPQVTPTKATGKRGPNGLAPRTNYSRVNSGVPPQPQLDLDVQPTGDSMNKAANKTNELSAAARPFSFQDMVKAAMTNTLGRVKVAEEAREALKERTEVIQGSAGEKKEASSGESYPTSYVSKLAAALLHIAEGREKEAEAPETSSQGPGKGPNASTVSHTEAGAPISHNFGQATQQPPKNPPTESKRPGDPATALQTDMKSPAGGVKVGSAPIALLRQMSKKAEDAINPAKISAGPAAPHSGLDVTQSIGGFPGNSGAIASNKGVIDLKKGEAKAPVKSDMKEHLKEPAQSASTDKVLQNAFAHTGEAGVKISTAQEANIKIAAARTLLAKLAGQ
jgi:hypothetical protein